MWLLNRPRRTKKYGGNSKNQHRILRETSLQKFRTKTVIGNADNRKSSRLHHRHSVQQRRYGRWGDRNSRKPPVKRENRSFHPKAKHGKHIDRLDQSFLLPQCHPRKNTTKSKIHCVSKPVDKDKPDKGERRATDGISHIFSTCKNRLPAASMHYKRHGYQGQHLIKHVHGHQVPRKSNAYRNPKCHRIKGKKHIVLCIMFHIFKRVERCKGPQK